jgi:two-component system invasion response regulator UvrY
MDNIAKIVLADDHTILRKGMANMLGSFDNIEVLADVGDGQALLEWMEQASTLPNVVVLDINMPVMNGYLASQNLKKKWPQVKVLALSMYDNEDSILKMLRHDANGYVLKDISPADLRDAIIHLLSHPFYYSDLVTGRMLSTVHSSHVDENRITDREYDFLQYCCTELTYKEIADKMFLSPRTIDGYRESLFKKLNVASRVGLAMYAIKTGITKL